MQLGDDSMDMHMHSVYSDGQLTPEELVKELEKKNIGTFAITDHDNIDAISVLKNMNTSLEWYNGVEVSTIYKDYKIHLLAYDFDEAHPRVKELLEWIKRQRSLRFYDMVKNAEREFKVSICLDSFQKKEKEGVILGRPHLMNYLVQEGLGENSEIMDRIASNCSSQISYRTDLKYAIECLKEAKALLVIAHPKEIEEESHIAFESIIEELALDIDGIEVYHSIHTDEDVKRFHNLARKYHLLESGGSDYHGPYRKERELGIVTKSKRKVKELSLVDELRCRK